MVVDFVAPQAWTMKRCYSSSRFVGGGDAYWGASGAHVERWDELDWNTLKWQDLHQGECDLAWKFIELCGVIRWFRLIYIDGLILFLNSTWHAAWTSNYYSYLGSSDTRKLSICCMRHPLADVDVGVAEGTVGDVGTSWLCIGRLAWHMSIENRVNIKDW